MSDVSQGLSSTDRKRLQRQRDRAAGWAEVSVRVAAEHAESVRNYAAQLPAPRPPADPRQLELLAYIDRQLAAGGEQGTLLL
jgi:hypothetical protein